MSFGFSASDFLALSQLIFSVSKALSDSNGSQVEYQGLIQTLLSLLRTVNVAEEIALRCSLDSAASRDPSFLAPLNAIAREREICHKLIEDFMAKSEKYTASFIHGSGRAKAIKKLTWCLFHSDDVQNLERKLRVHTDAIHFYSCSLGFQSLNASLASNTLVLTQIDKRTTMIYDMISQLFNIMPKALGYPWEGGFAPDDKPLRLMDALGRDLRIPAVFLTSCEVFHDMLEIIHRNLPGHRKIMSKEYSVADEDAEGQVIDPSIDLQWSKAVRCGKTVSVNMVFQTFLHNKDSEKCPRCRSTTSGPVLEGKRRRCQVCQLTFHISEEVRFEEVKTPSERSSQLLAADSGERRTETIVKPRQKKRQPRAVAKNPKEQEQDKFRRIHYIHELVKQRASDLSAAQQSQKVSDKDKYLEELPPLHQAAALGDMETVRHLLDDLNVDIESKGGCDNATALHYAAYQGRQDVAIFLIQRGAKVESRDCDGATPLHWSIPFGHISVFKLLLESGAEITSSTNLGRTPLHWCAWKNQPTLARFILEEGVDVDILDADDATPLSNCEGDSVGVIKLLVDEGADINAESKSLMTPLHYSVQYCSIDAINTLLDLGADVNSVDQSGLTPLSLAMRREEYSLEICELLIDRGADVMGLDDRRPSLIHQAIRYPLVLNLLRTHGADVDARDEKQRTPLHVSVMLGEVSSFRQLLEFGANINVKDNDGNTALHFAVTLNSSQMTRDLLELGAEIRENLELDTPLHRIATETPEETVRLLVTDGADVGAVNKKGCSPLHQAAEVGNAECITTLIELGADPNMEDDSEMCPIHVAAYMGRLAAVRTLLDAGVGIDYPMYTSTGAITPLHLSAHANNHDIVALLLQLGADALAFGDDWGIPLHLAAKEDAIESARILLADNTAREQIIRKNSKGMTPIALAARAEHLEIVKMFIQHPANELPVMIDDVLQYAQDTQFQTNLTQWYSEHYGSSGAG